MEKGKEDGRGGKEDESEKRMFRKNWGETKMRRKTKKAGDGKGKERHLERHLKENIIEEIRKKTGIKNKKEGKHKKWRREEQKWRFKEKNKDYKWEKRNKRNLEGFRDTRTLGEKERDE